jgi:hypothetical protein
MRRSSSFLLFLVLVGGAGGCGSSPSGPEQAGLMQFRDPASSFSTTDVRDVQEQIVRFDAADRTLIWAATGARFAGWDVSGNFLDSERKFQVRFGTRDGQRRAYFTETASATICDLEVVSGQLVISPTSVPVP